MAIIFVDLASTLVSRRSDWHARVQAWLSRRGDASAAAGIAALVGDLSAEELLTLASARFRYVTLDMITQEDMTRPLQGDDAETAKADLFAMSTPGLLGKVDAYMSHTERQPSRSNPVEK